MWEDLTKGRFGTIAASAAAMVTPGMAAGHMDGSYVWNGRMIVCETSRKKLCRAVECL